MTSQFSSQMSITLAGVFGHLLAALYISASLFMYGLLDEGNIVFMEIARRAIPIPPCRDPPRRGGPTALRHARDATQRPRPRPSAAVHVFPWCLSLAPTPTLWDIVTEILGKVQYQEGREWRRAPL